MRCFEAAVKVLKESGRPMRTNEIADVAIKKRYWSTEGDTPGATVSARLYMHIKKSEKGKAVVCKDSEGKFKYCGKQDVESSVSCKNESTSDSVITGMTFLQAAEAVLQDFANGKEMHYVSITRHAIEHGWLQTSGNTPNATMNAQLATAIKKAKLQGVGCKFIRTSPGYFRLTRPEDSGLAVQADLHNKQVRMRMLKRLSEMHPQKFEELIGQLLVEMGFESVEVTPYRGDNGIDVRGVMLVNGAIRIRMAVQVKRQEANIGSPTVQQVRGSLGTHERGMIITTSNFSSNARKEADAPNRSPIALIDGNQLVGLLFEYRIGVKHTTFELFEMSDSNMFD